MIHLFLAIIPVFLLLVPNAYAEDKYDWPEQYDDLPEGSPVLKCWTDGFVDGEDHPFDRDRNLECIFDVGEPYYEAFIAGCKSVEGNTEEICESVLLAGNNTITNETEDDEKEDECVPFNPDKARECARGFLV